MEKTHTKKQNQAFFAKFVNVLVSAMDSRGSFKEEDLMEMYKKREKQRACAALPVHSLLLRNSAMHGVKPSDPDPGQSPPGGPGGPGRPGGQ